MHLPNKEHRQSATLPSHYSISRNIGTRCLGEKKQIWSRLRRLELILVQISANLEEKKKIKKLNSIKQFMKLKFLRNLKLEEKKHKKNY